jgi:hypothetical protein
MAFPASDTSDAWLSDLKDLLWKCATYIKHEQSKNCSNLSHGALTETTIPFLEMPMIDQFQPPELIMAAWNIEMLRDEGRANKNNDNAAKANGCLRTKGLLWRER